MEARSKPGSTGGFALAASSSTNEVCAHQCRLPQGAEKLENVLPRSNLTILKLSGIIQPNLLRDGWREIVLGTILFSPQKKQ